MTSVREDDQLEALVPPTDEDPVAASASEVIGGPLGRRAETGAHRWWNPLRVLVILVIGMFALGMVQKLPCYNSGWFQPGDAQYIHACYSDIPHLFGGRGFSTGIVPYFDRIPDEVSTDFHYLEYPVLTGLFMEVASWFTPDGGSEQHREQIYWLVNAGMLMVCAVALVVCVARTHRRRPWDALLVALSPALALSATINWDLFAVALTAGAMLLWSRSRPLAAGVLLGLATAAKLYPLLLLGALFVLCLRAGRLRAFWTAVAGAVGAWLVVNLPVILLARDGWAKFYSFSQERRIDYGSIWLVISQQTGEPLDGVNSYAVALMLLLCAAIAGLALYAPRRPRFAQLAFLVVAAIVVANKVYSPQYVLWLLPLAVLARPRWRDFLVWQGSQVLYFLGIWMQLAYVTGGNKHHGLPQDGYHLAIVIHLLGTLYLCGVVVRDILLPERDVVRWDGEDDPSGGVLDGAPDVFVLGRAHEPRHAAPFMGTPVEWGVERREPAGQRAVEGGGAATAAETG